MTVHAYINESRMIFGSLHVAIVDQSEDGHVRQILRVTDDPFAASWEDIDHNAGDVAPTLKLPGEAGRALLDALVRHYDGAEDTRALRADYDAALKRADAKDAVLADVLRTLAGKVGA
jgi:hypothetical protein